MSDSELNLDAIWEEMERGMAEIAREEERLKSGQGQDASVLDAIDQELLGEVEPDQGSDNGNQVVPPLDMDRLIELIYEQRSTGAGDDFADLSQVYVESNEPEAAPEPEVTAEQAARISARPRRALRRRGATARGTLSGRSLPVSQPAAPQQPSLTPIESSQASIPESTAELPTDKGKGKAKETEADVLRREIREELEEDLKADFDLELVLERTRWSNEKASWESEMGRTKAQADQAAIIANAMIQSLNDKIKTMEQDSRASFSQGHQAATSAYSSQCSSMQEQLQASQRLLDEEKRRVAGHTQKIAEQEEEISRLRREGGRVEGMQEQLAANERILEHARREMSSFEKSWERRLAAKDEHVKRLEDQLATEQLSHDEAMRQLREQRSQPATSTEPATAPDPQPQQSLAHPDQQRLEAQLASKQAELDELERTTANAVKEKRLAQARLEDAFHASQAAKRTIRTLEGEGKVMTEAKGRLLQAKNSFEADLNQRNNENRALSEEVAALEVKLRRARRRAEKAEWKVLELAEAKEASEAEVAELAGGAKEVETGGKEMDSLLGGPMGAIEGFLGPLIPEWKEYLLWMLVILLLIGIVAAFSEASAAEMAREMWLERGPCVVRNRVLEDPWLDLSRGMYGV